MTLKNFLIRFFICIVFTLILIYSFIDKQNKFTEVQRQIPQIKKELQKINEDNRLLEYKLKCFESPQNLLNLLKRPEFSHLRYPCINELKMMKNIDEES